MNSKKLAALTDDQIKRVRELTTQKGNIEKEIAQIMGVKERKPKATPAAAPPPKPAAPAPAK
jgi:hypothetical protein